MREEYRSHVGVIMSVLQVLNSQGETNITKILFLANLPHKRAKEYLKKLEKQGYIEKKEEGRSKIYEITEEGRDFLRKLQQIQQLFNNLGFPL